ncbi:TPA: hypothetical protein ACKE3S_003980 [Enterobacter kobei]|uniref:hypothetical protein n=1 Tax=Enterobacter kobei TaxID=208224 RepID=UPI0007B3C72A|nr:hypothetical protein [Enterobacter kobei]KZQ69954.1 hypothetical protein A3N62_05485 [Enterobacter kobei]
MKQKFIEWFTKNNNGCSPAMEDDRSFVYEMTQHMFEAYQAGVAEGEARCAALAAENAGLSAVLMSVIYPSNEPAYQSLGMGCGVEDNSLQTDGYGACEYGWREAMERVYSEVIPEELPETPATDAFLAEVRAQGVEMLVKHCEQKALEKSYDFFMDAGAVAAQFAAQLRQEAQ